jgi:hypothetical protein
LEVDGDLVDTVEWVVEVELCVGVTAVVDLVELALECAIGELDLLVAAVVEILGVPACFVDCFTGD